MLKLSIPTLNIHIGFDEPIKSIQIENVQTYREIYFNTESSLLLFDDLKELNTSTFIEIIHDIYSIEINNRKNISGLYHYLEAFITMEDRDKLLTIESQLINLIDNLSSVADLALDYATSLSFNQAFSVMKLSLEEPKKDNILEYLLTYFKLLRTISKTRIIVTFNLFYLLTEQELNLLRHELELHNLYLLNFNINIHTNNTLIIDSENSIF